MELKIATSGIWKGALQILKDGKEEHSIVNDGAENFILYEDVKEKDSLQVKLQGIKSDDFGIEISVTKGA